MKMIFLTPDQLITLNDYPLFSNDVLRRYLTQCEAGIDLPLVPVIPVDIVRQHFDADLLAILDAFIATNPEAAWFMLDGSHRTTALTLTGHPIHAIVYAADADIIEARTLVASDQVLMNGTLDMTLIENCAVLNQYFHEKPYFQTVRQKTERLLADGHIAEDFQQYHHHIGTLFRNPVHE